MKKTNIGSKLALYPMPVTVVGAMVDGKVNWLQIDHVGIVSHSKILVSMFDKHFTSHGIKETKRLSVNIVDRNLLPKADFVGSVSGAKDDKSGVFEFTLSENGTPMINDSPLTLECEVVDTIEIDGFDNFICSIVGTYAADEILDEKGHIDYNRLKPVLFEFPTYSYLITGDMIGKCTKMH